jgi:hypothetical protein
MYNGFAVVLTSAVLLAWAPAAGPPLKIDVAMLRNLAIDRTEEAFGRSNLGAYATLTVDYERVSPQQRGEAGAP